MSLSRPLWLASTGVGNRETLPEKWSMTWKNWHLFMASCRVTDTYKDVQSSKGTVTLYDMNDLFVKPWTRGTGNSIALLMQPEPLLAELMISHAWGEDMEQCCVAMLCINAGRLLHNKNAKRVPETAAIWFCAFSQYQPGGEPGDCGPTVGEQLILDPFHRIITSPSIKGDGYGMVIVYTTNADLYDRLWCVLEISAAKTHNVEVHSACSWVYLNKLGPKDAMKPPNTAAAKCGNQADTDMITARVMEGGGFDTLDEKVGKIKKMDTLALMTLNLNFKNTIGPIYLGCETLNDDEILAKHALPIPGLEEAQAWPEEATICDQLKVVTAEMLRRAGNKLPMLIPLMRQRQAVSRAWMNAMQARDLAAAAGDSTLAAGYFAAMPAFQIEGE